jgi:hypothetical protein
MRFSRYWTVMSVALALAVVHGQEKNEKAGPSARSDDHAVEFRLADDSTVKMALQNTSIEVATRYGKLTVPVAEIRRIDFGLRIPEETARRIDTALAQLAAKEFKQREAAAAELIKLRELSFHAVQKATSSTDLEVARRAKEIVKTLIETVPQEKLHLPRHDTVVTLDFTLTGQVETASLKAKGPYFGEVSLKVCDIRTLRLLATDRETPLAVDAGRHGGQQETWMDTGVTLRAGSGLRVLATGTVDLRPADAGTFLVGPDGQSPRSARPLGGFGQPGPGGGRGGRGGGGWGGGGGERLTASSTPLPGTLLGRIGEQGRVFVIGSRYEGTASEDGKLYLRIAPNSANSESSGTYDVRVSLGR